MAIDLATLTARVSARVEAEVKTKAAKKSRDPKVLAEAAEAQLVVDWAPTGLVQRIDVWQCACGASGRSPAGLFIYYEHTRLANTYRLAAPRSESQVTEDLVRKFVLDSRPVSICPECGPSLGFTVEHVIKPSERATTGMPQLKSPGLYELEWHELTAPLIEDGEEDEGDDDARD